MPSIALDTEEREGAKQARILAPWRLHSSGERPSIGKSQYNMVSCSNKCWEESK